MTNLQNLSVTQLRRAIAIKEQIEQLQDELVSITGNNSPVKSSGTRRKMSAAARARISAGLKAKWAKKKGKADKKGKRKISAAVRAKMAAAAKARWAKAKASGKSKL